MVGDTEDPDDSRDSDAVDQTPSATDPVSQAKVRRTKKFIEQEVENWWKKTLGDALGRKVIWGILRDCGLFENRFDCTPTGFPDPNATFFHLGQKNIGESLYKTILRFDRLAVCVMHDENDASFVKPKPPRKSTERNGD